MIRILDLEEHQGKIIYTIFVHFFLKNIFYHLGFCKKIFFFQVNAVNS